MPILTNPKHELFAQALASGKTADQAYVDAGYKRNRPHASRLATKGNVQDRVAELQSRATQGVVLTKQWVIERLIANHDRAVQADDAAHKAVANRSLELLGKEIGMFIERREVGAPGEFDRMNEDELRRFIADEATALARSCGDETAAADRGDAKSHRVH